MFGWYGQNIGGRWHTLIKKWDAVIMDYLLHSEIIRTDEQYGGRPSS